jgi:hypothetical protein
MLFISFVDAAQEAKESEDEDDDGHDKVDGRGKKLQFEHFNYSSGSELVDNDELLWKPICLIAKWDDEALNKIVTLLIVLPSGVSEDTAEAVTVESGGVELVVKVKWPTMLLDMDLLHAKWAPDASSSPSSTANSTSVIVTKKITAYPSYYPRIVAIKQAFAQQRSNENEKIYSVERIRLPLVCQEQILNFDRVGDKSGTRLLYVDLMGPKSNYNRLAVDDFFIA